MKSVNCGMRKLVVEFRIDDMTQVIVDDGMFQ